MSDNIPNTDIIQQIHQFIYSIFPASSKGVLEIRPIEDKKVGYADKNTRAWHTSADELLSELPELIQTCRQKRLGCYFGVLPRCAAGKGKKEDIRAGHAIWSDIDDKDTGSRAKTEELVRALEPAPSVVVESGGGLHVYYFLHEATAPALIEKANLRLLHLCGGDQKAWNRGRIMRLPGSWHLKNPQKPFLVNFWSWSSQRYSLDELMAIWPAHQDESSQAKILPFISRAPLIPHRGEPKLAEIVTKMMELHPEIGDYYNNTGKKEGAKSGSEYDWLFTRELLWRGVPELMVIDALQSKIQRDGRKKRADYAQKTVSNALHRLKNHSSNSDQLTQKTTSEQLASSQKNKGPSSQKTTAPALPELDCYEVGERVARGKIGKPRPTILNLETIMAYLQQSQQVVFSFNEFEHREELVFDGGEPIRMEDRLITKLRLLINHRFEVDFSKDILADMSELMAHKNSYHPVRDWLQSLQWDGISRIGTPEQLQDGEKKEKKGFLSRYLGAPDDALHREIGMRWLIQAVARIYQPGCQAHMVLILCGAQDLGKSLFFRTMAVRDEWFSDSPLDIRGGKDTYTNLAGTWFWEFAELSSTKTRDSDTLKAFITSAQDKYTGKWKRFATHQKRQVVFVGSSNEKEILRDKTGNKRFFPVTAIKLQLEALLKDREQIWAEAVHMYKSDEQWHIRDEFKNMLKAAQEPYESTDSWMEAINNWMAENPTRDSTAHSTGELLTNVLNVEIGRQNRAMTMRLTGLLHGAGWKKIRKKVGSKRIWKWLPPKEVSS